MKKISILLILSTLILFSCKDPSDSDSFTDSVTYTFSANGTFLSETIGIDTKTGVASIGTNTIGPVEGPWIVIRDMSDYSLCTTLTLRQSIITGTGTFEFTANDGYFHPSGTNGNWVSASVSVTVYSDSIFEGTYTVTNRDDANEQVSGSFKVVKSW